MPHIKRNWSPRSVYVTSYEQQDSGTWVPFDREGPIEDVEEAYELAEKFNEDFEMVIISKEKGGRGRRIVVWFEGEKIGYKDPRW
jgi:hypothetical protein